MNWLRFSAILLVATLLNAGNLLNSIAIMDTRPDLLLILLVYFTINCDAKDAVIVSFAIGFAADISGPVMGPYTIIYGVLGLLFSSIRRVVIMQKISHQALSIFVTGVIAGILAHILIVLKPNGPELDTFAAILRTSIYSGSLGPFIWVILSLLTGWFGIEQQHYQRSSRR